MERQVPEDVLCPACPGDVRPVMGVIAIEPGQNFTKEPLAVPHFRYACPSRSCRFAEIHLRMVGSKDDPTGP